MFDCLGSGGGIRVDHDRVSSNLPMEDRHSEYAFKLFSEDGKKLYGDIWMVGVYDGHGGWECSELIRRWMHQYALSGFLDQIRSLEGSCVIYIYIYIYIYIFICIKNNRKRKICRLSPLYLCRFCVAHRKAREKSVGKCVSSTR